MKDRKYIAWLNGASIAVGGLAEVEAKARAWAKSPEWNAFPPKDGRTVLKITTYGRQLFVKSIIL